MQTRAKLSIRKVLVGILLTALLALTALPAAPALAKREGAPASGTLPASLLTDDGALNLATGFSGALDLRSWQVTLDAQRGPLFRPAEGHPSEQVVSGGEWSTLGTGMGGAVEAITVSGSSLYAGGFFKGAGTCTSGCNNIAKWDGNTWSSLGTGMNDGVNIITVIGSSVYAGGRFTRAGTCTSGCTLIAKWDGSTWSPLGTGINTYPEGGMSNWVSDIAISGSDLYVGGRFKSAGTCTSGCNYIARWNGSTWSALGTGMSGDGEVSDIVVSGNNVYVGGVFTGAGNCMSGCKYIARWDGSNWFPLGSGVGGNVFAIAINGSDVYAGGDFTSAGTCTSGCNHIAKWDGSTWSPLDTGVNYRVNVIAFSGRYVYAGGGFSSAGSCTSYEGCNNIAKWDGSTWSGLGAGLGMNSAIDTIAVSGSSLYIGGGFTGFFIYLGSASIEYHNIAKYTLSSNADLSNLVLSSSTLTPAFASDTPAYTACVIYSMTSLTVTPMAADAGATIKIRINDSAWSAVPSGSPSAAFSLNMGAYPIDVQVTSADGTTVKTYSVTATRTLPCLSSLVLAAGFLIH